MRTQADLPYRLQPERVSQDVIQVRGDTAIVLTTLSWKRVQKVGGDPTAFENSISMCCVERPTARGSSRIACGIAIYRQRRI
jgi:hypothetical protein